MRSTQILFFLVICFLTRPARCSELLDGEVKSDLVPSPVAYSVLLPDGYMQDAKPLPLLLLLHGGGGDREDLRHWRITLDRLWKSGQFPKVVAVMPTVTAHCQYVDTKDGIEKWESFLIGPFLQHLRDQYNISREREETFVAGFSMGGLGSLRLALKHCDKFAAVAAFEPGILPGFKWKDIKPENRQFMSSELCERLYGKPFDEAYWEANNPATIVAKDANRIRESGLEIYLECGDLDFLRLYDGAEFLHRVLLDKEIPHEYHLVRNADHVDGTIVRRSMDGLMFLARVMDPPNRDIDALLKQILGPEKTKRFRSIQGLDDNDPKEPESSTKPAD